MIFTTDKTPTFSRSFYSLVKELRGCTSRGEPETHEEKTWKRRGVLSGRDDRREDARSLARRSLRLKVQRAELRERR